MLKNLCAFALALALSGGLHAGSEPPVRESVDLALVTLNRLELQPVAEPAWGLLPVKTKQLPISVQVYLKPTGMLNYLHPEVQRVAAKIRRAVAPGTQQQDRLRDAAVLAEAVQAWLDAHLRMDPGLGWAQRPALDRREAWPKVSAILKDGVADKEGQALAAVALLRALKVPCRVALAQGHWTPQYWCALAPVKPVPSAGKSKRRAKAPRLPLGQWRLLEAGLQDADVDAYSLDAGVLSRLQWKPQEELSAWGTGWQRAVFAQGDSPAAHAAWAASVALGRLTHCAEASGLSVAASSALEGVTQGTAVLWVLTLQRWHLQTDGALSPLALEILTPYRPDLASWGRERRGPVKQMEMEAEGLWSDRPQRLTLHQGSLADEWMSPPPGLGVLHAFRVGLKRHASVLQATLADKALNGVYLRSDNLAPRAGATVNVTLNDTTPVAAVLPVSETGAFKWTLSNEGIGYDWITLTGSGDEISDAQRVELPGTAMSASTTSQTP